MSLTTGASGDNGGQWTHREWRVLRYLKVDTKIIPNTTPFEEIKDIDGLILSGGAPSVATDAGRMGNNGEYLDKAEYPIFGICAGMRGHAVPVRALRRHPRSGDHP